MDISSWWELTNETTLLFKKTLIFQGSNRLPTAICKGNIKSLIGTKKTYFSNARDSFTFLTGPHQNLKIDNLLANFSSRNFIIIHPLFLILDQKWGQFHLVNSNSRSNLSIPIPNLSIPIPFFPTLFLPNTFYHE